MSEDRINRLEMRLAELEDLVEQLNDVVARQADEIDALRSGLRDRAQQDEQPIGPHNDPPPHY